MKVAKFEYEQGLYIAPMIETNLTTNSALLIESYLSYIQSTQTQDDLNIRCEYVTL